MEKRLFATAPRARATLAPLLSLVVTVVGLAALATLPWAASACGTSKTSGCDPSHCAAGNQCIDDGSGSGASCHKVCTTQDQCPTPNWYCNDGVAQGKPANWCVPINTQYEGGSGQWNAMCVPSNGEGKNPDCDWAHGFACYATSPTDGNALCTQFGCSLDSDCPGGWWCSTQNVGPNATSLQATFGQTRTMCLPRGYCAPCKLDHDCYASPTGAPGRCVGGDSKAGGYCTWVCGSDSNCNPHADAVCAGPWPVCSLSTGPACMNDDDCPKASETRMGKTSLVYQHCSSGHCTPECGDDTDCAILEPDAPGSKCGYGLKVCRPRAGACVGDGGFCSPCRSDNDCRGNFCLSAQPNSAERFCSAKSTVDACDGGIADPPGCPTPAAGDNWKASACSMDVPGQCFGLVTFPPGSLVPGCWTPNR